MPYAFFDGDNIGNTIERLLIEGKVDEATSLSKNINNAAYRLEKKLQTKNGIDVIILGGDDLLIKYNSKEYGLELLKEIMLLFETTSGLSMSCGVGDTIPEAIQNLHLAKLYGKNQIKGLG